MESKIKIHPRLLSYSPPEGTHANDRGGKYKNVEKSKRGMWSREARARGVSSRRWGSRPPGRAAGSPQRRDGRAARDARSRHVTHAAPAEVLPAGGQHLIKGKGKKRTRHRRHRPLTPDRGASRPPSRKLSRGSESVLSRPRSLVLRNVARPPPHPPLPPSVLTCS